MGNAEQSISASGKNKSGKTSKAAKVLFTISTWKMNSKKKYRGGRDLNVWRIQEEDYCIPKQQEPDAEK